MPSRPKTIWTLTCSKPIEPYNLVTCKLLEPIWTVRNTKQKRLPPYSAGDKETNQMDNSHLGKLKPHVLGIAVLFAALLTVQAAYAQAAKPVARPAAAAPKASPVDNVIQLVKSGMSENLIIKTLQRQNKPMDLSPADLVKLKNAGVSENIINVMMDPSSTPAPAAAPTPAPAPAPTPAPAAQPAAAPTAYTPPPPVPNTAAIAQAMKKRVIVDEFDYSAVMTSVAAV